MPWPAITAGSLNGCTSVAPGLLDSSSSRSNAASGPAASGRRSRRSRASPHLQLVAPLPHDDERVEARLAGGPGDRLRVVAAEIEITPRAARIGQLRDAVERAAHLERAGALEELRLEARLGAERSRERARGEAACGGRGPAIVRAARSTSSIEITRERLRASASASRTVNAVSPPGSLSTETVPPIASVSSLTIASPSPVPTGALAPVALVEVEALERARVVVRLEARPRVLDAQLPGAATTRTSPPGGRQAQRVLDEVRDDLEHPVGVGDRGRRPVGATLERRRRTRRPAAGSAAPRRRRPRRGRSRSGAR